MKRLGLQTRSALAGAGIVIACGLLASMFQVGVKQLRDRDWDFWSNPPHMFALPPGNVGIGTAAPGMPLEVAGTVFSSAGGFMFPDGTVQGTAAVGVSYAQEFTVALSGGDYTTITAALNACVNPGPNNRYLVRVMPGAYAENVTMLSYVHLHGAGKHACRIDGGVLGADNTTFSGFHVTSGIRCFGTSPTITNNLITNEGEGVWVRDGGRPWIKENEILDCGTWGIHCDGWGTDAWIIANKIERNSSGGIRCTDSSPTISNNQILQNQLFGVYLIGALGTPSEPTIDDNVIGRTEPSNAGVGIYMIEYAEPRIIANDIWVNYTGIEIHPSSQPSVQSNNIGYNHGYGVRCYSSGASKPVVIKGNHIHSNPMGGLEVQLASPVVTHNNIHNNTGSSDIVYAGPPFPSISLNVFDSKTGTGAPGMYNVRTNGLMITP